MTENLIECMICGENFKAISTPHLRFKHNITNAEYRRRYPEAKFFSDSDRRRRSEQMKSYLKKHPETHPANHPMTRQKISKSRKRFFEEHPEALVEMRDRGKQQWEDPARRERASEKTKELWRDSTFREKILTDREWLNGEDHPMKRPEVRAKHKKAVNTPEYIAKFTGENSSNWRGGVSFLPYCHRFTLHLREKVRNRFNRTCINCGKNEIENGQRLSVHHVDGNKMQGCDDHKWFLVPLCKSCNSKRLEDSLFHIVLFWLKNLESRTLNAYEPITLLGDSEHIELSQIVSV